MRNTMELIKENNHKRDLLNAENEKVYEDLLLYIRTDLRVNEQAAEELLMDLLDHLIETQENGKSATDLFGDSPESYANELIANMPTENKRNIVLLFASGLLGLVGWFAVSYGIINAAISIFAPVENDFALGSGLMILSAIILVGVIGVFFIFHIIRSSVFKAENQEWKIYVYSGLFSMAAFAFVLGIGFFFEGIGPVVHIQWWLFMVIGLALLGTNKGMSRLSASQ